MREETVEQLVLVMTERETCRLATVTEVIDSLLYIPSDRLLLTRKLFRDFNILRQFLGLIYFCLKLSIKTLKV